MSSITQDDWKPLPIRKRTGTAQFHMSKEAVDFGQEDLEQLTEAKAVEYLARAIWGSAREMPCPHCGTIDEHYFSKKLLRWKCKCCGSRFSVTSNTVLAGHKLSLAKILKIVYSWANGASGKPALQLRRDWNVAYQTVFTLLHKMREGLLRGFNTGVVCGVHEMDGMDVNGRRYRQKRGKPLGGKSKGKPAIPAALLKPEKDEMGPPLPPKWGKAASQPPDRRITIVMRQRGKTKGKGAAATFVGVALTESSQTVLTMATRHASAESFMVTDEDPSYAKFKSIFAGHAAINHSREYSRDGVSNNQSESYNWRLRRAAEGIYLNPSNKYLQDYASEQAWREDTRRLSTGKKIVHLLGTALGVGISRWWRGYTQGKHRTYEFLLEGDRAAKGRGPAKGAKPMKPR